MPALQLSGPSRKQIDVCKMRNPAPMCTYGPSDIPFSANQPCLR